MENSKEAYLQSLLKWGDELKESLKSTALSEGDMNNWLKQIEDWQGKINNYLDKNIAMNREHLETIQSEGKRLLSDITKNKKEDQQHIGYGKHTLPSLPYAYDALEPYISGEIMRLHHQEHHQSYVDGLNEAERALYIRKTDDKLKYWFRNQAFHGSGHYLHSIFWNNMTPNSPKQPSGEILKRIKKDFGSWNKFKVLFSNTAASVEGNGWAVLLWSPMNRRLAVQSFEKHQLFQLANTIPLLVLDVWEHAYYLQYQTDKKAYIDNWWNVVNWDNVNERYTNARKLN
ncbi:superoxide dismutase [Virgibacillus sp. YIM 98842]|uniref:superoxide dismutase n=1 Tax=Virgibacillus sp. YIM 98842 TaxID=2663533 RepID=UPI0013DC0DB2|nr:superoxide dismutase [Virgibacillus sp. YIM 98842]